MYALCRVPLPNVPKRPVFYPDLGLYFRSLRKSKGLGFRQAVTRAEGLKIAGLSRQILSGLEHGQTKDPDPEVLKAIAALYKEPYADIAWQVMAAKYGVDLLRHGLAPQTEKTEQQRSAESQTPEDLSVGFVASPRLPASFEHDIMEAADALHAISIKANDIRRDSDLWSNRLAAIFTANFSAEPPSEGQVAGDPPPVHRDDVRTHDRQVAGKKRRSKR